MFFSSKKVTKEAPNYLTPEQKEIYANLQDEYRRKKKETTKENIKGTTVLTTMGAVMGIATDLATTGGLGLATGFFSVSFFSECLSVGRKHQKDTDLKYGTGLDQRAIEIDEENRAKRAEQLAKAKVPSIPAMLKLGDAFNQDAEKPADDRQTVPTAKVGKTRKRKM